MCWQKDALKKVGPQRNGETDRAYIDRYDKMLAAIRKANEKAERKRTMVKRSIKKSPKKSIGGKKGKKASSMTTADMLALLGA